MFLKLEKLLFQVFTFKHIFNLPSNTQPSINFESKKCLSINCRDKKGLLYEGNFAFV